MNIRLAKFPEDEASVCIGAAMFAREAGLGRVFHPELWPQHVIAVLSRPDVQVWLAVEGDAVLGGVGLHTGPTLWNPEMTVRSELFMWVDPYAPATTFLRLFRHVQALPTDGVHVQEWASLLSSPENLARVYAKHDIHPIQTQYWGTV